MFVFLTYLPLFLLKFRLGDLVGCGIKFRIQRVCTQHTFDGPHYPKNKKYLKNTMMTSSSFFLGISCFWGSGVHRKYAEWVLIHHHHIFSGIFCFWGSGVRQKYAKWVLVGCGIKFHIQRALLTEI